MVFTESLHVASHRSGYKHRLDVDELLDAVPGELATVAALPDAPEGQSGIGVHGFVDENHATLDQFLGDVLAANEIAREHTATQAENGVIGGGDRPGLVGHRHDGGHRSEQFLVVGWHTLPDTGQHGRWIVGAGAWRDCAAQQAHGSQRDAVLDLSVQVIAQIMASKWTDFRAVFQRISHPDGTHLFHKALLEVAPDLLDDDEPLGGDAAL